MKKKMEESDEFIEYKSSIRKKEKFDMGGCLSLLFGLWVPRLQKILVDDQSRFDVPPAFNLMNMTESFRQNLEKMKKVDIAVHMFTLENSFSSYVLIVLSKLCETASIGLLYFIIQLYNTDYGEDKSIDRTQLLLLLSIGGVFEIFRFLLKHFANFKSQKLGMVLVSSLNYLIKTTLFKKNLETNYNMKEQDYQVLLDKQTHSFESYPMYHLFIIEFSIHFLLTTILGFFIFRLNFFGGFFLLLVGFMITSSIFSGPTKKRMANYTKAKLSRIDLVVNTIKSKFYIKARAWEILFFNRLQRVRDQELDSKRDLENLLIVQGWMLWTISFVSLVLILIVWIKSKSTTIYYYFIIFTRLYIEYYFLFREILSHKRFNDDRKLCLNTISRFLDIAEVKPVVVREDSQVKNFYSVFVQAAYFSWNDVKSIGLKKVKESAHFGRYVKDNPSDTIFEEEEDDDEEIDEEAGEEFDEEEQGRQNPSKTRNSFMENSVAYTLKSETNYRKIKYEPNQVAGHDLTNLNIKIKKGSMCLIYGGPESGKTSIIKAILGEMLLDERFKAKVEEFESGFRSRKRTLHAY